MSELIEDYYRDMQFIQSQKYKWLEPEGKTMSKAPGHKVPKEKTEDEGKLPKGTKVKPLDFNSQKLSTAMKIMREVASAAQKPTPVPNKKQDKKVSKPGSKKQTTSFKKSNSKAIPSKQAKDGEQP